MGRRSRGGDAAAAAAAKGEGMRVVWRKGAVRLVFVSAIAWALLVLLSLAFHLWSCTSSVSFLSGHAPSLLLSLSVYPYCVYTITTRLVAAMFRAPICR